MIVFPQATSPFGIAQDAPAGTAQFAWQTQKAWDAQRDATIKQQDSDQQRKVADGMDRLDSDESKINEIVDGINKIVDKVTELINRVSALEGSTKHPTNAVDFKRPDKIPQIPGDLVTSKTARRT